MVEKITPNASELALLMEAFDAVDCKVRITLSPTKRDPREDARHCCAEMLEYMGFFRELPQAGAVFTYELTEAAKAARDRMGLGLAGPVRSVQPGERRDRQARARRK